MERMHTGVSFGVSAAFAAIAVTTLLAGYVWGGSVFVRAVADLMAEALRQSPHHGL
jgi:hypothetical protein